MDSPRVSKIIARSSRVVEGDWQFVAQNPRYHKLFGAVSISDDYTSISQNLIVRYLRRTATHPTWGERIRALMPFKDKPEGTEFGAQEYRRSFCRGV